ncbi:MAG: hypothetical protein H7Y42_03340 [Chitinophagaceae bacterium]|nr:hypothetical protein [Chitinophagaceae bacterium]
MKPGSIAAGRILLGALAISTSIVLMSWDGRQQADRFEQQQTTKDSLPKGKKADKEKKARDLDEVLEELDAVNIDLEMEKAMKEMQNALKNFDGAKIKLDIEKAMKEIDFTKIQKEVQESMAKLHIDMDKLHEELKTGMKELDGKEFKMEMENLLKEVDMQKIQKEVQESLSKMDWDKMKKELDEVKKIDFSELEKEMEKVKIEMKELGPKIEKELQGAKIEIEKAKAELKEFKTFVDGLEKDGLIKKNETYTIRHENGELFINDKKASSETYNKYKTFLHKHKDFNLKKTDDDFDLDID